MSLASWFLDPYGGVMRASRTASLNMDLDKEGFDFFFAVVDDLEVVRHRRNEVSGEREWTEERVTYSNDSKGARRTRKSGKRCRATCGSRRFSASTSDATDNRRLLERCCACGRFIDDIRRRNEGERLEIDRVVDGRRDGRCDLSLVRFGAVRVGGTLPQ